MQRLDTGFFYQLGWQVHQLAAVSAESTKVQLFWTLVEARGILETFMRADFISAPLSKQAAGNLAKYISDTMPKESEKSDAWHEKLGYHAQNINVNLSTFENILRAELAQIETFVTAQKGIYDTKRLVEAAEFMFSVSVREWLSDQAVTDIQQAGRCLAFELPTAVGFHLTRAVEDSMRKYYQIVSCEDYDIEKQGRSWARYINALKSKGANEKVLNALDQMRELHRNPINHPDVNLSIDEAMMLMGLAQSAIVAMATDSKDRSSATTAL